MKSIAIVQLVVAVALSVASADVVDPMQAEQLYTVPVAEQVIPDELIDMLGRAAGRPDAETRLETLEAVRRHEIAALADVVRDLLNDDREVVRIAAVRAARALDLDDTADRLAELLAAAPSNNPTQRDLIRLLDRALADWSHKAMTAHWIDRLGRPEASAMLRASAAESLGVVHAGPMPGQVVEALAAAAGASANPVNVRLAAARAVAPVASVQPRAVELLDGALVDRLVGLRMIGSTPTPETVAALRRAAGSDQPTVQAGALRLLIDAGRSAAPLDLLTDVIDSPDPHVRRLAVTGARLHPEPAAVTLAFARLNDPHPDVRAAATDSLVRLADSPALADSIRDRITTTVLNIDKFDEAGQRRRWGEAEQLAHLARRLNHAPAGMPLVGFYDHPRIEATIAAVHAVRRLDAAGTRPPTVALMAELIERVEARADLPQSEDDEAVARFSRRAGLRTELARVTAVTLGAWAEPAADPVLRKIIPKNHPIATDVRGAGVWALGRIHAGQADDGLARSLVGRMNDYRGLEPEADVVRLHAAIALGRMQAQSALSALRNRYADDGESLEIRAAARWAIGRITGEMPPALTVGPDTPRDTFIIPLAN